MKVHTREIRDMLDSSWLKEHSLNLYHIARKQTFDAYHKEAAYVHELLQQEGFESQLLTFPADGKTVYQDKCSPIGWDATTMRLMVLSGVPGYENRVIADMEKEPLMAVKHSVSTPPEGMEAKVVTEGQMKAGEDVRGAFVLLDQDTRPCGAPVRMLLDLGAVGWISDYLENPHGTPDSVSWLNAGTEYNSWHIQADDRDFISFQISPRDGFALRAACQKGNGVKVHAVSDGYRHESTIHAVTALLPGEEEREVWIVSHLYEPLIDDNSNGVIGSIGILKVLRELIAQEKMHLKYSVRVVFAAEYYGFAAVADFFGGDLSKKTIGAINTDGTFGSKDKSIYKELDAYPAPDFKQGYAGNLVMRAVCDEFEEEFPEYKISWKPRITCGDDCALGDPTIGLPVLWVYYGDRGYHHNSYQSEAAFDIEAMTDQVALYAALVRGMAAMTNGEIAKLLPRAIQWCNETLMQAAGMPARPGTDKKARMEFLYQREKSRIKGLALWGDEKEIIRAADQIMLPSCKNCKCGEEAVADSSQAWFDYAGKFVFGRIGYGFPHDLMKRPREERQAMPGNILYSPLSDVLSRMDGEKTLKQVLTEVEWDTNTVFDEKTIRQYLYTCTMLAESGYLTMQVENPVTTAELVEAMRG